MPDDHQDNSTLCPCGSGKLYTACCGPYLRGEQAAPTPEALMRSRYTAFTQANIEYLSQTIRGPALKAFNYKDAETWARGVEWVRLEVHQSDTDGNDGYVEFTAHYKVQGRPEYLHEHSKFKHEAGRWYYVNSIAPKVTKGVAQKVGRNDPCPCGSGKKYKRCCVLKENVR